MRQILRDEGIKYGFKKLLKNPRAVTAMAVVILVLFVAAASFVAAYPQLYYSTLSFQTNLGTPLDAIILRNGSRPEIPQTEREYNTFGGWFFDSDLTRPYDGEPIFYNTTLYAKWDTIFTNQFFVNLTDSLNESYGDDSAFMMFSSDDPHSEEVFAPMGINDDQYHDVKMYVIAGSVGSYQGSMFLFSAVFANMEDADKLYQELVLPDLSSFPGETDYARYDVLHLLTGTGWGDILLGEIRCTDEAVYLIHENKTEVSLLRDNRENTAVVVPAEFEGLPVTKLGPCAYHGKPVESMILPAGLRVIGREALAFCYNLTSLDIPPSVDLIGNAFIAMSDNIASIELHESEFHCVRDGALYDTARGRLIKYIGDDVCSYIIHEGTVTICDLAFAMRDTLQTVVFPEGLKSVLTGAFTYCNALETLTFPSSLIEIADAAFFGNESDPSALTTVDFGENSALNILGSSAFAYHPNLVCFTFPKKLTDIGSSLLEGCTGLQTVTFEAGFSYEAMPDTIFNGCSALQTIVLPDSVQTVGNYAFFGCSALKSASLPCVNTMGESAFSGCTSLINVAFSEDAVLKEIPNNAFSCCAMLSGFVMPAAVERIGDAAFSGCTALLKIDLPNIVEIGDYAFAWCSGLTDIAFGENLEVCGTDAFISCYNVVKLVLPSTYIDNCYDILTNTRIEDLTLPLLSDGNGGYLAFSQYFEFSARLSLRKIQINNAITSVPDRCFYMMPNLQEVGLPATVTSIGIAAFFRCALLKTVSPLSALKEIGDQAFCDCAGLTGFTLPEGLVSIGASAFSGCVVLAQTEFPAGLKSMGNNAFVDCPLSGRVVLPDGMEYVGRSVFGNCENITELRVPLSPVSDNQKYPESLRLYVDVFRQDFSSLLEKAELTTDTETVPTHAFERLPLLRSVILPDNVQRIDDFAFVNCLALETLDISMTHNYGKAILSNCLALSELHACFAGTTDSGITKVGYFYQENGEYFSDLIGVKKLVITCIDGTLAAGAFASTYLEEIVICEGLTEIPQSLCDGCQYLKSFIIPESVCEIQSNAFRYCASLKTIHIPSGVSAIRGGAFQCCTALETVEIPEDSQLYSLGDAVFFDCSALTNISFPDNTVWRIPYAMFQNCAALTSFTLPEGIKSIETSAFMNSGVTRADIPKSVSTIGMFAYKDCAALVVLQFATSADFNALTKIDREAFENCILLQSVVFPKNLNQIVGAAFRNCTSLREAYILHAYDYNIPWQTNATNLTQADEVEDGVFYNCHPELKLYVPLQNNGITVDIPEQNIWNGVSAYKRFAIGWNRYNTILYAIPEDFIC